MRFVGVPSAVPSYGRGRSRHWLSARVGRPHTRNAVPWTSPGGSCHPVRFDASWQRLGGCATRWRQQWCGGAPQIDPGVRAGARCDRSARRRVQPLLECQRKVLRRSRMTRGFLYCVRARERKVGSLVPNHSPELGQGRPIREYPDHRRTIGRVPALEAVAQTEGRRSTTVSTKAMSAPGTPSSRHASASSARAVSTYAGSGWATRTRSDWTWTPSRAYNAKSGKSSRPMVNVPSADPMSSLRDSDAWFHRAQGVTADRNITEA